MTNKLPNHKRNTQHKTQIRENKQILKPKKQTITLQYTQPIYKNYIHNYQNNRKLTIPLISLTRITNDDLTNHHKRTKPYNSGKQTEINEEEQSQMPSEVLHQIYVFNGDFTDRGGSGYQIIFSLCFMLLFSDSVYLNRGNHESLSLGASTTFSSGHSFIYEMNEKFPEQREFYSPLLDFFSSLPLATQIQDVLVVHGGTPSTQYSINQLNTVNRFVQDLEPIPSTPENAFHEFLWSYNRNSKTASFLMQNKLQTLVVGHSSASFHSIYTFTKQLELHSIVKDETMFQKVKQMFGVGSNERLSVVEVFSSPTNGGELYAAVIECPGGRINNDPLKWEYFKIGQHKDFKLKHK
ncbi:Serine/threonine-protein_phosphatase [Hexamita inflata]|uniref:Serine/threonine-protein phosphatase n=1 Tax=Hexamita inflata TaxID=28002 RepID=A0AA86P573_9EUKA|nr:Serine/threonine-protein phosphatase [Hexamita inflata]